MLKHPNIIRLTDVFRQKGKLHLVFEFMERNVLQCIEASPRGLKYELIRMYVFQLCKAIEFCHRSDILHRGAKPTAPPRRPPAPTDACWLSPARTAAPGAALPWRRREARESAGQ